MQALFDRRVEPGAFLSQSELVKILGVPVGPLRDALRVLQAEGWLTIHARSGIELRKPDFALVRNSYQLRMILERAAVRTFSEIAPLDQIEQLEKRHIEVVDMVREARTHPTTWPASSRRSISASIWQVVSILSAIR